MTKFEFLFRLRMLQFTAESLVIASVYASHRQARSADNPESTWQHTPPKIRIRLGNPNNYRSDSKF